MMAHAQKTPDRRRRPLVSCRAVSRLACVAAVDSLEPRRLLAAGNPSTYEQYMLELVNRARANPTAEASRLGIALNEGLAANTISGDPKQPLAMNEFLTAAARDHVTWLRVNGKFQHEGSGNSTPTQRMISAGYPTTGSWGTGENLGVVMGSVLGDVGERVETNYENLFIDKDYAGRGHRVNLLNPSFEEMGSGVSTGAYNYNGQAWQAVLTGQDFAYRSGNPFITGVAYTDALRTDNFYSPGEGMSGVTIVARAGNGATYLATTPTAGGFSIQVPAGTYTLTATHPNGKTATYTGVVVGGENVKRDFKLAQFSTGDGPVLPAPGTEGTAVLRDDGQLVVTGTGGRDTIAVAVDDDYVTVTLTAAAPARFARSLVNAVSIDAGRSNDLITIAGNLPGKATIIGGAGDDEIAGGSGPELIYGGDGSDTIRAGSGDDTVYGGEGDDNINGNGGKNYLYGEDGMDRLNGGGGRDFLFGGAHNDRLYGNAGNDDLDGGGNNDRLYGGTGDDLLMGGNGIDRLYGNDGNDLLIGGKSRDVLNGGAGRDILRDREDDDEVIDIEIG